MDLSFLNGLPLKLKSYSKIPIVKVSIITIGIIFILYVIGIGLVLCVDPNKYKDSIEKLVSEQTQKVFIINGPIHLQCFPWLAIELNDVMLKKKPSSKKNVLTITKLKISPKFLNSLRGAISFNLEITDGKIKKYLIHGLKTNIYIKNEVLELKNTKINLAGNEALDDLEINLLTIDTSSETPKYFLKLRSKNFQFSQLIHFLSQKNYLTGDTFIDMELKSEGTSIEGLRSKLSGFLELEITQGKFHGIDLIDSLKEAKSLLDTISSKLSHTLNDAISTLTHRKQLDSEGVTPFNTLKMKAKIEQGIMNTQELNISHHHYDVKGTGLFNIIRNTLDYQVEALYKKQDKAKKSSRTKARLTPLKIHISGPTDDPSIKPDFNSYLKYIK